MELKEIASVSGKPGLFRILKPTRSGVIVENLGANKVRTVVSANFRISILKEVSIYTTTKEGSILLEEVLYSIFEKYGKNLPFSASPTPQELKKAMEAVVPDYDVEKVYQSDMKKLFTWYNILLEFAPEVLERKTVNEETPAN